MSWLLYFKRYCKLKFKNNAKFCVQICPIFAGPVTFSIQVEVVLRSCYIANMAQISESMRYSYKAKESQALYFDSKQFFEWATVIILLSWQFSLHDDKERSYGLNDCNCSFSIHFSFWIQMVCTHGCTVIHRCSLYTFFIMSKYSGIQI